MRLTSLLLISGATLSLVACSSTPDHNPIVAQTTKYKSSTPYTQSVQAPTQSYVTQAGYQTTTYQTQPAAPVSYQPQTVSYAAPASYTQVHQECLSKESNRKIIGTVAGGAIGAFAGNKLAGDNETLGTVAGAAIGGVAGYGIADKTINCDPVSIPAPQTQQTAVIAPAYQPAPQPATTTYAATTAVPAPTYQTAPTAPAIVENTASLGDAGTPGYYAIHGTTAASTGATTIAQPVSAPSYSTTSQAVSYSSTLAGSSTGSTIHTLVAGDTVYSLARSACVPIAEFKQLNSIDDNYYIRAGDTIKMPASRCIQ